MWQLCLLTILYFGFLLIKIMLSCLYLFHFLILSFLIAHLCWIIQASLNPLSHFHYCIISRIFFLKLWPSFLWCFHFFLPLFLQLWQLMFYFFLLSCYIISSYLCLYFPTAFISDLCSCSVAYWIFFIFMEKYLAVFICMPTFFVESDSLPT